MQTKPKKTESLTLKKRTRVASNRLTMCMIPLTMMISAWLMLILERY